MLLALLNICSKEELEESEEETVPETPVEEFLERKRVIKNKILAVGRMSRVFALLRSVEQRLVGVFINMRHLQRGIRTCVRAQERVWGIQITIRNTCFRC
jgi:hypothetical protein